jgi:hypothetical protein
VADDKVAENLAHIRKVSKLAGYLETDLLRLVAGYDALLRLAAGWDDEAARDDARAGSRDAPAAIMLSTRAAAQRDCAIALRAAISHALLGEDTTDDT